MTRKDYKLIADAIKNANKRVWFHPEEESAAEQTIDTIVDKLCADLKRDNPAFDKQKFIDACYN